jgi:hypothetical protein
MHFLQTKLLAESPDEFVLKSLNELSLRYQEIKLGHDSGQLLKLVLIASIEKYQLLAVQNLTANNSNNSHLVNTTPADNPAELSPAEPGPQVEVKPTPNVAGNYDFAPILDEISRINSRLGAILATCEVKQFVENRLTLATNFLFNHEVLKKTNSKQLIVTTAKKYYPSLQIRDVECMLVESVSVTPPRQVTTELKETAQVSPDPVGVGSDNSARIAADNKNLVEALL